MDYFDYSAIKPVFRITENTARYLFIMDPSSRDVKYIKQ